MVKRKPKNVNRAIHSKVLQYNQKFEWSIASTCGALCENFGVIQENLGESCNSSQLYVLHHTCIHTSPRPHLEHICEFPLQEKFFCSSNQVKQSNFALEIALEPCLERQGKANSCKRSTTHLRNTRRASTTKLGAI